MEARQSEQAPSYRSPEASLRNVASVIEPDGSARRESDPRLEGERVVAIYRAMVRTRLIDIRLEKLQRQGRIGFHVGCRGEEAAIVGAAAALREQDWIFPCYREFGALLWRGFSLEAFMDNMFGNKDDMAKGHQMPDHYTAHAHRYTSVSSPVGTQIPQAVGFAWASKLKKRDEVTAVFLGDGATSSADFHAGMNFAGVFRTPVVFLCRNNRWAISVPSERQTAAATLADKAIGYGLPGLRCDGNDALAVYRTVHDAMLRASRGEGPTFIEMLTYRLGAHSTSDDPKAYRKPQEVEQWERTDPLVRLRRHLDKLGLWDDDKEAAWSKEVEEEMRAVIKTCEAKPRPRHEMMFEDVYEQEPPHLTEQREALERGPRAPTEDH